MEEKQAVKAGFAAQLVPVMFCFFVMGFVDLVGIATNFVQKDLGLSDSTANIFPSLVFFWFLIFSVPTGLLMNRIGRKKTVQLSLLITLFSLIIPIFGNSFSIMLIAFSLLGIGNALMQTSLNPLVSNIIAPEKLASTLTFGQFIKAIASFMAPIIATWGFQGIIPGIGWRTLFPIYAVICLLSVVFLAPVKIPEKKADKVSGFAECFKLLGSGFIFLSFCGIMCHVGIDVGVNTTAPRILMEKMSITLEEAAIATSVYFIFRTLGCLTGSFILRVFSAKLFFGLSALMILAGLVGLFIVSGQIALYVCIALIGFGNSNIFPIIFSQALIRRPDEGNEVSGLMIMGLFGGTLFPLAMGFASDMTASQTGALVVLCVATCYLVFYTLQIKTENV